MKFWLLIILFGVSSQWTLAQVEYSKQYIAHVERKTLKSLSLNGSVQPSYIELSNAHIEYIESDVFENFTDVTMLNLENNNIRELPLEVFRGLSNLIGLSLADNALSDINGLFSSLWRLEWLDISRNPIKALKKGDLHGMPEIATILTVGNEFDYISSQVFKSPFADTSEFEVEYPLTYEGYTEERLGAAVPLPDAYQVKVCKTSEGIIESVKSWKNDEKIGHCTRANIERVDRSLLLTFQGIRKFRSHWYQLPRFVLNKVDLTNNNIGEITPELLNDLPTSLVAVDLGHNVITTIRKNVIKNIYIKTLILDVNNIEVIEDGAFEGTSLTTLRLKANKLKDLAFVKSLPKSIEGLTLSANLISEIPVDTFAGLNKLKLIELNSNYLNDIEPGIFKDQENLRELKMVFCNITYLNSGLFSGLKKLTLLDLSHNQIETISENTFSEFKKSDELKIYLNNNRISVIEKGSFSNFRVFSIDLSSNRISDQSIADEAFDGCKLQALSLNSNFLTGIDSESFKGLWGSYVLDLSDNQIHAIRRGDAKYFGDVKVLKLDDNPLTALDSGALHGLSTDRNVKVSLRGVKLELIHGGLFEADPLQGYFYKIV